MQPGLYSHRLCGTRGQAPAFLRSILAACAATALALAAAGCSSRGGKPIDAGPAPAAALNRPPAFPTNVLVMPPSTVLTRVNGKDFTLDEARREVAERFAAARRNHTEEDWARRQPEHLQAVCEQFVMRTLLLEEADRRGITLDAQETSNAFARIQQQLPAGKTVDQVMKDSPMGEARMREEVLVGARINKLFSEVLPRNPVATDRDVADFAAAHPDLKAPETVEARHILIEVAPADSEAAKKVKRAKIEALRKQLLAGADFAQLARDNSQCPSAARGGSLGVFRRGHMVPEFDAAAFSQKPGEIGDVVVTKFGYHLIKVSAHHAPAPLTPERLRALAQKELGKKAYEAFLDDLRRNAKIDLLPLPVEAKP